MAGRHVRPGGVCDRGVCMAGGSAWRGVYMAGETATAANSTHPTGMHSSFTRLSQMFLQLL